MQIVPTTAADTDTSESIARQLPSPVTRSPPALSYRLGSRVLCLITQKKTEDKHKHKHRDKRNMHKVRRLSGLSCVHDKWNWTHFGCFLFFGFVCRWCLYTLYSLKERKMGSPALYVTGRVNHFSYIFGIHLPMSASQSDKADDFKYVPYLADYLASVWNLGARICCTSALRAGYPLFGHSRLKYSHLLLSFSFVYLPFMCSTLLH